MLWENSSDRKFGQKVRTKSFSLSHSPFVSTTVCPYKQVRLCFILLFSSRPSLPRRLVVIRCLSPHCLAPCRLPSSSPLPHCLASTLNLTPRHPSPPLPCPSYCFRCLIKKVPRVDSSHTPLPLPLIAIHTSSSLLSLPAYSSHSLALITLTRPHHTHHTHHHHSLSLTHHHHSLIIIT